MPDVGTAHAGHRGAGRSCPLHYRYAPEVFRCDAELLADTLYVAGGLYGNRHALDALLVLVEREAGSTLVVFNGDFHWFDVGPDDFLHVHEVVLSHHALRGNVETELAASMDATDCGCGYPDWVAEAEVERSNAIIGRLQRTARACLPQASLARLAALPMHTAARVADCKVAIVHGDWESLAGWKLAACAVHNPRSAPEIVRALESAGVDAFASSHTCLPALGRFVTTRGPGIVINNGAAGMPNFRATTFGLCTRISTTPSPTALYGERVRGAYLEAVPLEHDATAWLRSFSSCWPPGSAAHDSYFDRIRFGPSHDIEAAIGNVRT